MNPFDKYKTATVLTGSSNNQLIFVFDEIIKLLFLAQKAIDNKDYETKYKTISKVIEVFYILKSGITDDHLSSGDAALDIFYSSTIFHLEKINLQDLEEADIKPILEAMSDIRVALSKSGS